MIVKNVKVKEYFISHGKIHYITHKFVENVMVEAGYMNDKQKKDLLYIVLASWVGSIIYSWVTGWPFP